MSAERLIVEPRPWRAAAVWLAVLAPFFFLTYGLANWISLLREPVPSIAFAWERWIPFLPWTIVPYWSTDLFYAASLFICRSRRELDTHARRLIAAQLISVACFLVCPLRFSFAAPETSGLFGWMFAALGSFDKPYNQAPSLHLSLLIILHAKYSEHFRGIALSAIRAWLALSAVSTLTTYQHHFIDLPTGVWVGLACVALFPAERTALIDSSRSIRVAVVYAAASALIGATALLLGGWTLWLLWPASSLILVAGAYLTGSPGLFRNRDGRIDTAVSILLAPYFATRWAHARWSTRHDAGPREIGAGVWIGGLPRRHALERCRIASIVNVAAELPTPAGIRTRGIHILDLVVPSVAQIEAAVQAIDALSGHRPTVVCCALGRSRSVIVVAAWLMANGYAESVDDAIRSITRKRPSALFPPTAVDRLENWARRVHA